MAALLRICPKASFSDVRRSGPVLIVKRESRGQSQQRKHSRKKPSSSIQITRRYGERREPREDALPEFVFKC